MDNKEDISDQIEALFLEYLRCDKLGLKKETKTIVRALIGAITAQGLEHEWTDANLSRLPMNGGGRIRQEIFRAIVFPVLKARFDRGEAEASYLLGKHIQNLMTDNTLKAQTNHRWSTDYFRQAFYADPSSKTYETAYLEALVEDLAFTFHEWPSAILIDHSGWRVELEELRTQLLLVKTLDRDGKFDEWFSDWFARVDQYEKRLAAQHGIDERT